MSESVQQPTRVVPRPDPLPINPLRALVSPYTALATIHLISNAVVGAVTFSVVVTMLALSVSLLPLALLGLPVFVGTVHAARAMSAFERGRFRLTLGMDLAPAAIPRGGSFFRYVAALVSSPVVWRELAYHLVLLPWGVVTSVVTTVAWTVPIALITLPLYYPALPGDSMDLGFVTIGDVPTALAASGAGLFLLVLVTPGLIRGLRLVDAELGRSLLSSVGSGELAERVDVLTASRTRAVDSAQAERLRIERDLHDGAQQRLVSLAMTLGRAKSRMGGDADARRLVDEAHEEAKLAIVELRDLTRGLQPPVLADRGLDAALSALTARSPVPVDVDIDVTPRPSPTVEAIAYFVVAESLTNIAKHSGASRAWVHARRVGDAVRLVVGDDGMGGADVSRGSGIAGIADRISGVDGTLTVDSPAGGPTLVTVVLPCG